MDINCSTRILSLHCSSNGQPVANMCIVVLFTIDGLLDNRCPQLSKQFHHIHLQGVAHTIKKLN